MIARYKELVEEANKNWSCCLSTGRTIKMQKSSDLCTIVQRRALGVWSRETSHYHMLRCFEWRTSPMLGSQSDCSDHLSHSLCTYWANNTLKKDTWCVAALSAARVLDCEARGRGVDSTPQRPHFDGGSGAQNIHVLRFRCTIKNPRWSKLLWSPP